MVDAISSIRQVGASDSVARAAPAAVAEPATTTAAAAAPEPLSPRLTNDFLAGAVVMEVESGGQTITLPSAAALAYLRAGLNAQGQPIVDPYAPNSERNA